MSKLQLCRFCAAVKRDDQPSQCKHSNSAYFDILIVTDDDNYWGHCTVDSHENFYLNIGKGHWMVCHECKIKWFIGANLFSSWRQENRAIWIANSVMIKDYIDLTDLISNTWD